MVILHAIGFDGTCAPPCRRLWVRPDNERIRICRETLVRVTSEWKSCGRPPATRSPFVTGSPALLVNAIRMREPGRPAERVRYPSKAASAREAIQRSRTKSFDPARLNLIALLHVEQFRSSICSAKHKGGPATLLNSSFISSSSVKPNSDGNHLLRSE